MLKEEKFKVINFVREMIVLIDTELDNFPKKDIEIKNRLRNSTYDLLELVYFANTAADVEVRKNLLEQAISKMKVIDFLVNLIYDKKIINSKKYYKLGQKSDDIVKYLIGWIKSLNIRA